MSEPGAIDKGAVSLNVDDQTLVGTLLRPEVPVPGFLFIHGWGGDQDEDLGHAEELARLGCVCFTFDLRGHAGSDARQDEVTRQDGLDDVTAAYDYLAAQPLVDRSAIGVVGTSYGGYLAMLLTARRPVRWLAMRVPALYPDDQWDTPKAKLDKAVVRAYRQQSHAGGADRALSACAAYRGDVLIVESERDEQIPREALLSMQAAFRQTNSFSHRIIPGATHSMRDPKHQRIYSVLLTSWIEDMVRASRFTYR
ncbi:S9 family peptidase [Sphingomonas sp. S6]|jgi:dienelactone hydrolase|uniref:alpha/beta hydrolase family protein n=1 Tax=Sphingomonas sp. S6 TaxID=3368600 RepID=UPI000FB13D10|nr:MAG: alpha/beta fold hydrolase [Sphingomonadaceae bacterium]